MAKREMICPFSGGSCRNCALYIGRHYYRCYYRNYRGYVTHGEKEERDNVVDKPVTVYKADDYIMPETKNGVFDPYLVPL